MNLLLGKNIPGGPIHGWQLGGLFLPFVLVLMVILGPWAAAVDIQWLLTALSLLFLGLMVLVWIVGLVNSFPFWTLPALGVVLFGGIFSYTTIHPTPITKNLSPFSLRGSKW